MNKIEKLIRRFKDDIYFDPVVYCFKKEDKLHFDECKAALKENGFSLVDVNQEIVVKPEDYNMLLSEAGFNGPTGKETINDCLVSDEEKRSLIIQAKTGKVEAQINKKSVLVIEYNEQIISNRSLYETLRIWLKDGVSSLRRINAIVYLETNERIRDFCYYGDEF